LRTHDELATIREHPMGDAVGAVRDRTILTIDVINEPFAEKNALTSKTAFTVRHRG
jgi:hypothetical protein